MLQSKTAPAVPSINSMKSSATVATSPACSTSFFHTAICLAQPARVLQRHTSRCAKRCSLTTSQERSSGPSLLSTGNPPEHWAAMRGLLGNSGAAPSSGHWCARGHRVEAAAMWLGGLGKLSGSAHEEIARTGDACITAALRFRFGMCADGVTSLESVQVLGTRMAWRTGCKPGRWGTNSQLGRPCGCRSRRTAGLSLARRSLTQCLYRRDRVSTIHN